MDRIDAMHLFTRIVELGSDVNGLFEIGPLEQLSVGVWHAASGCASSIHLCGSSGRDWNTSTQVNR